MNPRQEMLRRYYDAAPGGTGFDYAYRCPGMNKVLQAAGRVIRTSEDKGVVLLLDDRFARSEYTRRFPRHWGQTALIFPASVPTRNRSRCRDFFCLIFPISSVKSNKMVRFSRGFLMVPGNYREHSSVSLSRQINLHKDRLIC